MQEEQHDPAVQEQDKTPGTSLVVTANKKLALLDFFLVFLLGLGVAAAVYFGSEKFIFKYSFYKYKEVLRIVAFCIIGWGGAAGMLRFTRTSTRKFIFSERFIEERRLIPLPSTESCDMNKVVDVSISFGSFWTVKIVTKDISSPVIQITGLTENEAKKIQTFVRHYAVSHYTEYRQMKDSERKGK